MPANPILIVDDDPVCCRGMAETLANAGYRVEPTTDAIAALMRAMNRQYALVVTDLAMPMLTGTALLAEVRRTHPDTLGLLVCGFPDRHALAEARVLGVPVLAKPFTDDAILAAVNRLLRPGAERSGTA